MDYDKCNFLRQQARIAYDIPFKPKIFNFNLCFQLKYKIGLSTKSVYQNVLNQTPIQNINSFYDYS